MLKTDGKTRFTTRVESYRKFRPGYPVAVAELLERECGLAPDDVIADVGAGTGILSERFLESVQKLGGASQEQVNEGDMDHGFSGSVEEFVVFAESA